MKWPPVAAAVILSTTVLALATGCASKSSTTKTSQSSTTSTSQSSMPSTSGTVAASPTSASLTGTWQGYAGVGARSTSVTMNLRQDGQALKGDVAVGGRPDLSGGLTGAVDGDTLRLRLENGASAPQLRLQGDTITGVLSGEPLSVRRVR